MPSADKKIKNFNVKKIAVFALLVCVTLILSYIESIVFSGVFIPGVKLGLSNTVVVVTLYLFGFPYALVLGVLKSVVSLVLFGRLSGLLYSFFGIIFAIVIMGILKRTNKFSLFGVSVSGSFAHIFGQLFAACLMLSDISPLRLLPFLGLLSLISGAILYFPEKSTLQVLRKRDFIEKF